MRPRVSSSPPPVKVKGDLSPVPVIMVTIGLLRLILTIPNIRGASMNILIRDLVMVDGLEPFTAAAVFQCVQSEAPTNSEQKTD